VRVGRSRPTDGAIAARADSAARARGDVVITGVVVLCFVAGGRVIGARAGSWRVIGRRVPGRGV